MILENNLDTLHDGLPLPADSRDLVPDALTRHKVEHLLERTAHIQMSPEDRAEYELLVLRGFLEEQAVREETYRLLNVH